MFFSELGPEACGCLIVLIILAISICLALLGTGSCSDGSRSSTHGKHIATTIIRGVDMTTMPIGLERWHAFEDMLCECSGETQRTLLFLRNKMVLVQVLRNLSFIIGFVAGHFFGCGLAAGLGLVCNSTVQVLVPVIGAFASTGIMSVGYVRPTYRRMCTMIRAEPELLLLLRRASRDDPVLAPALEVIERWL